MINKRGMSGVIVTVLLIALSIAAVAILWVVVSNMINDSLENSIAGSSPIILTINEGSFKTTENGYSIKVERSSGEGELVKVKFILTDLEGDDYSKEISTDIGPSEGRTFDLPLFEIFGESNFEGIKQIKVVPIMGVGEGKEKEVGVTDKFIVKEMPIVAKDNLVAYYPLDGDAKDNVGSMDGEIHGDNIDLSYNDGERGTVAEFGYDEEGYIVTSKFDKIFGSANANSHHPYSISAWFKSDKTYESRIFGHMQDEESSSYCTLRIIDSTTIRYHCLKNNPGDFLEVEVEGVLNNEWHQVIVTRDEANKAEIYLDGEVVGEGEILVNAIFGEYCKFSIGGYYTPDESSGKRYIDNVKVFNKALNEKEVKMLYFEGEI